MPVGNMPTFSSRSSLQTQRLAMPVLQVGDVQIQASYGILFAAIALLLSR